MLPEVFPTTMLSSGEGLDLLMDFSFLLIGLSVVILLGAIGALNVWAYRVQRKSSLLPESVCIKRFFCPVKSREVEVDFLTRTWEPTTLLTVTRCTAFCPGQHMDCDQACLRLPEAQAARPVVYPLSYRPIFLL